MTNLHGTAELNFIPEYLNRNECGTDQNSTVGIDLVEHHRFRKFLQRGSWDRMFSPQEISYALAGPDPVPHLAAAFATKEAAAKAIGISIFAKSLRYYELSHTNIGAPKLLISPEVLINEFNYSLSVSITHSKHYSAAVVLYSPRV